jgi:hypothetical protein
MAMGEEELVAPPADTQIGKAARLVAEVFGCSVEEAARVLALGINARIAEEGPRPEQGSKKSDA